MGLLGNFKALLRGNKIDVRSRFELLREAISGTMSNFYMARDRQTGKVVGLKILDPAKTAALESRFTGLNKPTEGEISIRFDHPRIVKTLEYGITTKDEQYVVMEFLDGPGLNSLIVGRDARMAGHRIGLLRQAAEALDAVHKAGFIHRDVCPRNFVANRACDSLKLIDFGLSVPATPPFMQPGNRTGTANYMAPEVVRRKATSNKLDVFAFGVTAFELCAFDLPWPRGTDGRAAMVHDTQEPIDIHELCPGINQKLGDAIMACVHTAADSRPAMEDFLTMISKVPEETVA